MDIRKISKKNNENKVEKNEEIEALEYMVETMHIWDKYDSLNMEEHNDDAQRSRTQRKSTETLRTEDREGGTTVRKLSEEASDS